MHADIIPLIVGALIFISSLISLKLGLSVAIIEIVLGVVAGNLGLKAEERMMFLAPNRMLKKPSTASFPRKRESITY